MKRIGDQKHVGRFELLRAPGLEPAHGSGYEFERFIDTVPLG